MRIYDCRIFRLLPHFLHISAKCAYRFFPHKQVFLTANFNIAVFLLPISIRFRYLDHLVASRMAPSVCPDPWGTRWGSWFQAILYHVSAYFRHTFGVYGVRIFFKWHIKLTCLISALEMASPGNSANCIGRTFITRSLTDARIQWRFHAGAGGGHRPLQIVARTAQI